MDAGKIRVLCVDDHAIVREGISLLIDRQPDMKVVAVASNVKDAFEAFRSQLPDITLMDLRLGPDQDGSTAICKILGELPAARIIVLTMYEGEEDIHRAMKAGAMTYVLKDTLSDDLIHVIRSVHRGEKPIGREIKARIDGRMNGAALTGREVEVVELLAAGMRNKEIASALHISEGTVQVHMRNIFTKLDVNDRTGALNVAVKRGIIHLV